jgi:predicted acylesterase/phospholipase RssA
MDINVIIRTYVGNLNWADFSHAKNLIQEGEKAARENLDNIHNVMSNIKKWFTLKHLLKSPKKTICQLTIYDN